jgi:hypothetical protein
LPNVGLDANGIEVISSPSTINPTQAEALLSLHARNA